MADELSTIYVELLDEGTPCFRPVRAERISEQIYRIADTVPEDERWMFQPGDTVLCDERVFSDGSGRTAYRLVSSGV